MPTLVRIQPGPQTSYYVILVSVTKKLASNASRGVQFLISLRDSAIISYQNSHKKQVVCYYQDNKIEFRRAIFQDVAFGFIALLLIVIGASQTQSPFALKQPCAWFYGVPNLSCSTLVLPEQKAGPLFYWAIVAVYSGLFIYMRSWLSLARTVDRFRGVPIKYLFGVFFLFVIPILVAPPLFSRDSYSYAGQGEMVARGIDPYKYGVSILGPYSSNLYIDQVDPLWQNTPVPYGPLDLRLAAVLDQISYHNELISVLLLRIVMGLGGVLLAALCIPRLSKYLNKDPSYSFVLAILNPVVILHLIGGIHNDALMAGFLMIAVVLALEDRYFLALIFVALATQVKAPAVIALGFIGWRWAGEHSSFFVKLKHIFFAFVITLLGMEIISLITGVGWGWIHDLGAPDTVISWLAPASGIGIGLSHIASALGIVNFGTSTWLHLTRTLGLITASVLTVYFCVKSDQKGFVYSLGLALTYLVILSPVVQPWYLSWGIMLVIISSRGWVKAVNEILAIGVTFVGLPGGKALVNQLASTNPIILIPYIAIMFAVLVGPSVPFLKRYLHNFMLGITTNKKLKSTRENISELV